MNAWLNVSADLSSSAWGVTSSGCMSTSAGTTTLVSRRKDGDGFLRPALVASGLAERSKKLPASRPRPSLRFNLRNDALTSPSGVDVCGLATLDLLLLRALSINNDLSLSCDALAPLVADMTSVAE